MPLDVFFLLDFFMWATSWSAIDLGENWFLSVPLASDHFVSVNQLLLPLDIYSMLGHRRHCPKVIDDGAALVGPHLVSKQNVHILKIVSCGARYY